jgi:anti-anti-sigma regulatory factor
MSMHFVSHPWEVQDVEDGTVVKLTERDLQDPGLTIDLLELALESGRPRLFLDLLEVRAMSSGVAGKLFALDRQLREANGRLVLTNLAPTLCEALQARNA